MTCIRCGSTDVHRSRRKGLRDQLRMWFGRWPYRCPKCGLRFWANKRYITRWQGQSQAEKGRNPDQEGPEMAFRTHGQKPQAEIIVQAESHEQLNDILFALNQAINSYQQISKKREQTTYSFQ